MSRSMVDIPRGEHWALRHPTSSWYGMVTCLLAEAVESNIDAEEKTERKLMSDELQQRFMKSNYGV